MTFSEPMFGLFRVTTDQSPNLRFIIKLSRVLLLMYHLKDLILLYIVDGDQI